MNVSKHFIIIVTILLLGTGGAYYFFTKTSPFETANAENLSQLDQYLLEEFSLTLSLDKKTEDAIRVFCVKTASSSDEVDDQLVTYPCQNENPVHKVVIGSAKSSTKYMDVMQALGNEQLYWRDRTTSIVSTSTVTCTERVDYPFYTDVIFGMNCVSLVDDGESLYSSIFFLQPKKSDPNVTFISVLNTGRVSSLQQVETELTALVAKKRVMTTKLNVKEIFASAPSLSGNGAGVTFSTSEESSESEVSSPSNSSNVITKDTGSSVDATVCDAVDSTSCYPVYCESVSAVWNYSRNTCVEPVATTTQASTCPKEEPVWDGSKCRALIGDVIISNSCSIPVGKSSCEMTVAWYTQNPKGTVEARLPLEQTLVLGTGQIGTARHTFQYQKNPYTVELHDTTGKLNDGAFTTVCASGGWDSIKGVCVDPHIEKIEIFGEYYESPGTLKLTCENSSRYFVRNTDTSLIVASGTYELNAFAPLPRTGNYIAVCADGEYEGVPSTRYYNAPPPPAPDVSLIISPRTLSKNQSSVINWNITFPVKACKLTAAVVCKEGKECTPEQVMFEDEINTILENEMTDETMWSHATSIPTAVSTVAQDHVGTDWKAVGQKTLVFKETTDVTLDCGNGHMQKKRVYVRAVTQTTNEQ